MAERGRSNAWEGGLAAAAATSGWVLHDLALTVGGAEPALVFDLLPGSLVCIAAAAIVGTLLAVRRGLVAAFVVVALIGAVLPRFVELPFADSALVLPKAAAGLALAALIAGWLARSRGPTSIAATALGLGGLAAAGLAWIRAGDPSAAMVSIEIGVAVAALIWLAIPFVPRRRAAVASLALAGVVVAMFWTARSHHRPPAPVPPEQRVRAGADAPNVLLIVLDTVAAQHLAPYGYRWVTTPRLDAFAARWTSRYDQARSLSSWTLPSHGALFTGLMPSRHGAIHHRADLGEDNPLSGWPAMPMRRDVPTLAGSLAERGWQTAAIIGNSPFVSRQFGFDRGFEYFDDRPGSFLFPRYALAQLVGFRPGIGSMGYRRGETITDLALDWLDARKADEPFFLFVNYMDVHYPYIPAPSVERAHAPRELADPLRIQFDEFAIRYDRELSYMDAQLGRLLDRIVADGRLDDTLVVITSDHGEVFGAKGFWFHNFTLYEDLVRVPLYVHLPGQQAGDVVDTPADLIDVYHLVRRVVGLPPQPREAPGWIGEWYRDEALIADLDAETQARLRRDLLAWVEGGRKTIVDSFGGVQIYDVLRDPRELRNLAVDDEERQEALSRAERWWAEHPPLAADAGGELDDETLERLRNLGYVK